MKLSSLLAALPLAAAARAEHHEPEHQGRSLRAGPKPADAPFHVQRDLQVPPPPNDLCTGAEVITWPGDGASVTVSGSTADATDTDNPGDCGTTVTAPGVWYTLAVPTTRTVTFSTCNQAPDFDTKISVYKGECSALVCVDGQDDTSGCGVTTELGTTLPGMDTYYIFVHGFGSATGDFNLTVTNEGPESKYLTFTFDPTTPDTLPQDYNASQAYVDGLIQNFISNDGLVQFESATFTGHKCFGLFADGLSASASWPDEGIIMSSGLPENIVGPNNSPFESQIWDLPGDSDLDALVPGFLTEDACIIEFQFACPPETAEFTPEVNFNYVFGSEEYLEYVFDDFNDVFGFFLNDQNIALVPGTIDTPVTIDTVNNVTNTEFFVDNTGPIRENNQADGYTTLLTATGSPVAGTNTIKLAIADVGDGQLDSWVLLQAGTFSCTPLTQNPTESPTKNPTKSPTKNPTESPTLSLLQAPPAPPPPAPVPSWCPGELGTDFCLDECVQCTTDGKRPGCVYHHEVGGGKGGGKCSLQCIGCGGTCGLLNAKGKNKNNGKPKPVPGCASQACVNQGKYAEACGV